jgi:hypothetical protein
MSEAEAGAEPVAEVAAAAEPAPEPEAEAGPEEKGAVAPIVVEPVDPLGVALDCSADDQCVPAAGESRPEKAGDFAFVDATEKKVLQVAEAQFDKLAFSGTDSKLDTGRETILHREAGVAVRLMDRSIYAGVLFITTYRVALFSPQLPDDCAGPGLARSPRRVSTLLLPARYG